MSLIIDNLYISSLGELYDKDIIFNTTLHINAAEEIRHLPYKHLYTQINLNWFDFPLQNINENSPDKINRFSSYK